jgi:hypothetical protein
VAAVLGHIGDTWALPYLEKLLAEIKSSPASPVFGTQGSLSGTIEAAIARIKKTGHWSVERNENTPRLVATSANESGRHPPSKKPE